MSGHGWQPWSTVAVPLWEPPECLQPAWRTGRGNRICALHILCGVEGDPPVLALCTAEGARLAAGPQGKGGRRGGDERRTCTITAFHPHSL